MRERRIMAAGERVDHAWLDTGDIHLDLKGISCRIEIGREGGAICTDMRTARRLNVTTLSMAATEAALAAERSAIESGRHIPLLTEDGRAAEVVGGSKPKAHDDQLFERNYDEKIMADDWPGDHWRTSEIVDDPRDRLPILLVVLTIGNAMSVGALMAYGVLAFVPMLLLTWSPVIPWTRMQWRFNKIVRYENLLQRREDERQEALDALLQRQGKAGGSR